MVRLVGREGDARARDDGDGAPRERIAGARRGGVDARDLVVVLLEQVAHRPEGLAIVAVHVERELAVADGEAELRLVSRRHAPERPSA